MHAIWPPLGWDDESLHAPALQRYFMDAAGTVYRVGLAPHEWDDGSGVSGLTCSLVFETREWIGFMPVHCSVDLDRFSDAELRLLLAQARSEI